MLRLTDTLTMDDINNLVRPATSREDQQQGQFIRFEVTHSVGSNTSKVPRTQRK